MAPRRRRARVPPSPLASRIRAVRERLNLTQAAFARLIGGDPRVLWRWEAESVVPAATSLATIAKQAGVDAAWLISGDLARAPKWFRPAVGEATTRTGEA